MKKINILKDNKDFDRIIKNNDSFKTKYYYIYIERKEEDIYKFGISVSKKIGNAVTRNLYKRRIKDIIDDNIYQNNFNCIIILKKSALDVSFKNLKDDLNFALKKLKLIKEL